MKEYDQLLVLEFIDLRITFDIIYVKTVLEALKKKM